MHRIRLYGDERQKMQQVNCIYRPPTERIVRIPYPTQEGPMQPSFIGNQLGQFIHSASELRKKKSYRPSDFLYRFYKYQQQHVQLALALSEEVNNHIPQKVLNTMKTMHLFQEYFSIRVVYFSSSQLIIDECKKLGIDVVTEYITNYKGLPIVREMYNALKTLYTADYYGYVNSDILLSPSLFAVLSELSQAHANQQLTDGFLVSGVSFNVQIPTTLPLSSPMNYALFVNAIANKDQFRSRGSSDFWIFHHTVDFSLLSDVVIGRIKVDTYIMSLVYNLNYSVVDVTYAVTSLHQGREDFNSRTNNNKDPIDVYYNDFFLRSEGIPDFMLSSPGDCVLYWLNQSLVLDRWNRDAEKRERQREELIREIRTSHLQHPKTF